MNDIPRFLSAPPSVPFGQLQFQTIGRPPALLGRLSDAQRLSRSPSLALMYPPSMSHSPEPLEETVGAPPLSRPTLLQCLASSGVVQTLDDTITSITTDIGMRTPEQEYIPLPPSSVPPPSPSAVSSTWNHVRDISIPNEEPATLQSTVLQLGSPVTPHSPSPALLSTAPTNVLGLSAPQLPSDMIHPRQSHTTSPLSLSPNTHISSIPPLAPSPSPDVSVLGPSAMPSTNASSHLPSQVSLDYFPSSSPKGFAKLFAEVEMQQAEWEEVRKLRIEDPFATRLPAIPVAGPVSISTPLHVPGTEESVPTVHRAEISQPMSDAAPTAPLLQNPVPSQILTQGNLQSVSNQVQSQADPSAQEADAHQEHRITETLLDETEETKQQQQLASEQARERDSQQRAELVAKRAEVMAGKMKAQAENAARIHAERAEREKNAAKERDKSSTPDPNDIPPASVVSSPQVDNAPTVPGMNPPTVAHPAPAAPRRQSALSGGVELSVPVGSPRHISEMNLPVSPPHSPNYHIPPVPSPIRSSAVRAHDEVKPADVVNDIGPTQILGLKRSRSPSLTSMKTEEIEKIEGKSLFLSPTRPKSKKTRTAAPPSQVKREPSPDPIAVALPPMPIVPPIIQSSTSENRDPIIGRGIPATVTLMHIQPTSHPPPFIAQPVIHVDTPAAARRAQLSADSTSTVSPVNFHGVSPVHMSGFTEQRQSPLASLIALPHQPVRIRRPFCNPPLSPVAQDVYLQSAPGASSHSPRIPSLSVRLGSPPDRATGRLTSTRRNPQRTTEQPAPMHYSPSPPPQSDDPPARAGQKRKYRRPLGDHYSPPPTSPISQRRRLTDSPPSLPPPGPTRGYDSYRPQPYVDHRRDPPTPSQSPSLNRGSSPGYRAGLEDDPSWVAPHRRSYRDYPAPFPPLSPPPSYEQVDHYGYPPQPDAFRAEERQFTYDGLGDLRARLGTQADDDHRRVTAWTIGENRRPPIDQHRDQQHIYTRELDDLDASSTPLLARLSNASSGRRMTARSNTRGTANTSGLANIGRSQGQNQRGRLMNHAQRNGRITNSISLEERLRQPTSLESRIYNL